MTTVDRLYAHIKQDIITCSLAPGTPFSESELCRRYRASRTPVREACRRLEREGLITIVPFRGYFVAPLTLGEFQNLQELQLIVDPAAAALAATRATPEQLKRIENAGRYEYRVGHLNSYFTFLQHNFDLHVGIAEASQNEDLVEVTTSIQTRLMRFFYLIIAMDAFGPTLVSEHEKIVSAIRSRKPELARERAADHVRKTIERSGRLLMRPAQPQSVRETGVEKENLAAFDLEVGATLAPVRRGKRRQKIETAAGLTVLDIANYQSKNRGR